MNTHEIIKILDRRTTIPGDGYSWSQINQAIDAAIEALEKERRKYTCPMCNHEWWEDRDASDYPNYCPGCGEELRKEG